jgi:uncharacterized RDD family membrane protein YckC
MSAHAGPFKRFTAFFIDITMILLVVFTLFTLFVSPFIEATTNYEPGSINEMINQADDFNNEVDALDDRLETEDSYTQSDYEAAYAALETEYNQRFDSAMTYIYWALVFHLALARLVNYLYNGFTRGQTLGRRAMKIYMSGRISWWTLFIREVLWKSFFWVFTVSFGIWIDFLLISFTRSRKTIRDHVSGTRILLKDIVYPF